MPVLTIEKGKAKGKSATVDKTKPLVVGRDTGCDLIVDDTLASRRHFQVMAGENGEYLVEDLQSMNGTFLNERKIQGRSPLAFGDTIGVGLTRLVFVEGEKQKKKGAFSGKTIHGYEVGERIGRGGMGTVYRATQLSLSREVALKFLSPELNRDEAFVKKFVQEARSAGALNHPNIIQVYDVSEYKAHHYFSMEYAARGNVEDLLEKSERLPAQESLRIVLDAARGLEFAHKKGIVHRDIKPDNLMVAEDGTVKIGDLGLALNTQTMNESEDRLGNFGTPHFASPEQIKGGAVDIRSDLYSLGATFYRIVSGRTPFVGKNVREIMLKQVKELPPPVTEHVPDLPQPIALVIEKLLAKDPTERFATPTDLIAALERIQQDLVSGGSPGSRRTIPWRRFVPLAVGAVLVLLTALGVRFLIEMLGDAGQGGHASGSGGRSGEDREAIAEAALRQARSVLERDSANRAAVDRLASSAEDYADRRSAHRRLRYVTVEGAGHMLHHDQPERVAQLIEEFMCEPAL